MSSEPRSPREGADSSDADTVEKTLEFDFGTYQGEVSLQSGLRNGWGLLTYNSGNSYEGVWCNGAAHGEGTKRYRNGDVYSGHWANGKRSGVGQYTHVQGDVYVGEYHDDVCHGNGCIVTRNGDRYDGEWYRGKKHGHGVETLASGQSYDGQWAHSKKHGKGSLTLASERILGIWDHDVLKEVLDRQEMEYQPQVRPMVRSSMSDESGGNNGEADPASIALQPHVIEDMRRAGADPGIIRALTEFSDGMSTRMGSLMGGIGSIEAQLASLTDALEHLAEFDDADDDGGYDGLDDGILSQIESIRPEEGEEGGSATTPTPPTSSVSTSHVPQPPSVTPMSTNVTSPQQSRPQSLLSGSGGSVPQKGPSSTASSIDMSSRKNVGGGSARGTRGGSKARK